MSKYSDSITSIKGDDLDIIRHVVDLPAGQSIVGATLTVKNMISDADASAVWQKLITTTYVAGTGQVQTALTIVLTTAVRVPAGTSPTRVALTVPLPIALPADLVLTFAGGGELVLAQDAPKGAIAMTVGPPQVQINAGDTATFTATPLLFELTPADTVLLTVNATVPQVFDIPIHTSTGKRYTPFMGTIYGIEQVTTLY